MPGTSYELDPVQAAFNIGAMVRWLDFNDTWLAAEWGHPSDNLGGILAVADYLARNAVMSGRAPLTVRDVLTAMIKAHEIQGVLALENSFNRVGLDHVLLVRVASTAVVTACSAARPSRSSTRSPTPGSTAARCAPTGTPPTPARARAGRRGMPRAARCGSRSSPSPGRWATRRRSRRRPGASATCCFKGQPLSLPQPFGSYVMENVLFKISFPAEFHAQTAVEAAMQLHGEVAPRLEDIERVVIETQEPGVRIIDKTGPLANPADRDHCIQYMVAIPLIFGRLTAADYEDEVAKDPRIDTLRAKMQVRENATFTAEYYAPEKRYIGNAVQVFFRDGSHTARVQVDFPIGHRKRRAEGMPVLVKKFEASVEAHFQPKQAERVKALFAARPEQLEKLPVNELMAALVTNGPA